MATIREKGPYQWQVQIRRKGWPNQSATFRSKKTAEAWARKAEREMDQGFFVDQAEGRQTTLGDLIELYLEQVTANRPSEHAQVSERSKFMRFMREEKDLCAHAVVNLTPEQFEDYRDHRKRARLKNGKQIKPSTVNKELMQLKRVIDHRMRRLGLVINPVNTRDVKRLPVNDERDVRLSAMERKRLLEACSDLRNPLIGPFVEMGFETGARRGSLLRLEWRDVCLKRRTALLRGVKNSRSPEKILNHRIGLTPRAVEILEILPHTDDRVFPMTENAFRLAFNRAREKAGLKHFRFHDTRHERVSSLFEAGWSMVQVMAQSGHRDPKSVKRYANISGEFLADQLAKL
ncbi:MAG: tyrosine-type recombinase/integrase [Hyphomicrobiales bacterium]|nr:tyrosine-type recombinase/integrase [Hyphomicrobiales bacterium]